MWNKALACVIFQYFVKYNCTIAVFPYQDNGGLERTAKSSMCASNFALDWKIQCCRKLWNVESSFWQANIEKNASFWVVFQVQKWCDLAVAVTPRMSIDNKKRWKCGFSKLSSEREESPSVSCWHMGHYFGSVRSGLKDSLNMHQIAAKFVPDCC